MLSEAAFVTPDELPEESDVEDDEVTSDPESYSRRLPKISKYRMNMTALSQKFNVSVLGFG